MELLPADYIVGGLIIVTAVLGLFRGFSGTLAFFVACACAAAVAMACWPFSATLTETMWIRGGATLVTTLVSFGLTRLAVKKLVNGLLAQPTDAILGAFIGAAFGVAALVGWAYSGFHLEYSSLAAQTASYLR